MPSPVTESALKVLIANLGRYLANLARAGISRKRDSRKALQGVILATRETQVYLRALKAARGKDLAGDKNKSSTSKARNKPIAGRKKSGSEKRKSGRDFKKEEQLALRWTTLSFELRELGVSQLAKRCDIAGDYWTDPDNFSMEFLSQARARLKDLELEARGLLRKIG